MARQLRDKARQLLKQVALVSWRGLLTLLSLGYGFACRVRLLLYRVGLFRTRRLPVRVMSVGNLTVGGTGKTPLVIALAESLSSKGIRVGVLSRGYRGRRSEDLEWVSDGKSLLSDPRSVGDEPYLIAARLKTVPVIVGKNRYRTGSALLKQFAADLLLLDDGYQHVALNRDINLLIIDGILPFGAGQSKPRLIPRGMLREPLEAIRRASAVLISRMEQPVAIQDLLNWIRAHCADIPVFEVFFRPTRLIHLSTDTEKDPSSLKGQAVLAFSGIGNPGSFRFFLERLGAKVVHEVAFRDHHEYTEKTVRRLTAMGRGHGADRLVTTEKDGVKIRPWLRPEDEVWALRIGVERIEGSRDWDRFLSERINHHEALV